MASTEKEAATASLDAKAKREDGGVSKVSDAKRQKMMDDEAAGDARDDAPASEVDADEAAAKEREFEEASAVVTRHVKLLREYNEIKDVAQQLMGIVAENRGVTVGSLYATGEFGVGRKD